MKRFFRCAATLVLGSALLACSSGPLGAAGARTVSVPQSALQEAVAKRFPYRQRVAEVLDLQVQQPRLALLPADNRLGTQLDLNITDRFMQRSFAGAMAMDYGLRFEHSDNSIRMSGVRVSSVSLDGIPEPYRSAIARHAPRLAEQLFADFTLHQFSEQDMGLVNGLGLEPGQIKVTPKGLDVTLQPLGTGAAKSSRPAPAAPAASGLPSASTAPRMRAEFLHPTSFKESP